MWGKRAPGNLGGWIYLDSSNMTFRARKRAIKEDREERFGPWQEVTTYQPPTVDSSEEEVELSDYVYQARPPGSFVVSGTIGGATGPGRNFDSAESAEQWVLGHYGRHYGRIHEAEPGGRWAFVVLPRALPAPKP